MKWFRLLPVLAIVFLAGCPKSKIHQEKTYELDSPSQTRQMIVDPPTGDQKIKVVVTSTMSPVSVYILVEGQLGDKIDDPDADVDPEKLPAGAVLAKEKNTKEATLTATVPAKKGYRIFLTGATKKTTVTVKLDSM